MLKSNETKKTWRPATEMVHGGTARSGFGETSEALFLTQGFVYDTAEAAEARFLQAGDDEYIYARKPPRPASRARNPASSIRAMPIRRPACSRSG